MDALLEALAQSLAHSGPEWVGAIGLIATVGWGASQILPFWQTVRLEQLNLEKSREPRKAEDAKRLDQRDKERSVNEGRWIEQYEHANAVQEQTNEALSTLRTAVDGMRTSMDTTNMLLQQSKDRSKEMGAKIDAIHNVVIHGKEGAE